MPAGAWVVISLAGAVLLLSAIGLLSCLQTAVISARRSRLAQEAGELRASEAEAILHAGEPFRTSAHLAKSLCESLLYAISALLGLDAVLVSGPHRLPASVADLLAHAWPGLLAGALAAYFLVTVFGESLPKAYATRRPERVLLRWCRFIRLFTLAFVPVLWVTRRFGRAMAMTTGTDPELATRAAQSEDEIRLLVEGSAEEGVLEEDEKEMIHSIFEFTETVARQVMVPRIDIHSVPAEAKVDDVVGEAMASGHSRLPVHDGTIDHIVGIIHAKDLLGHLVRGEHETPVRELMREPYFVPEGKKIDELLQEFRHSKSHIAIVVDEYGGTSGLVTVEDVLEEIVGEIEDEYDVAEPPALEAAPNGQGSIVDARMTLDDLNELMELHLPEEEFDTLGGFVFSLFGRPPHVGESVRYENVEFRVEATDGLRLQRIRVVVHEPAPVPEATA